MCLIIHKPAGVSVPEDVLVSALKRNPDGWGIMYRAGATRVIHGLYNDQHRARKVLRRELRNLLGVECLIHLRMATHGATTRDNVHPFRVAKDTWMMHNGILDGFGSPGDDGMSDTREFIDQVLAPCLAHSPDLVYEPGFQRMLSEVIGGGNRLAFMGPRGAVIINEGEGVEYGECWLSNTYAWSAPMELLGFPNWSLTFDSTRAHDYDPYFNVGYTTPARAAFSDQLEFTEHYWANKVGME